MIGQLPRHLYVYVDSAFTHQTPVGFIPAVWFGLVSVHGRMWGCTVLLECGAVYRNLPPHALAFTARPEMVEWSPEDAQVWDCYGDAFDVIEYRYLAGLMVVVYDNGVSRSGTYLFSVAPKDDGFSLQPEQAKEFSFIALSNGRLTIQPTNHLVFDEASFTTSRLLPTGLRRQTEIWSCE